MVLIGPTGKILLQLRDDGKGKSIPYPNMWGFPGGANERLERYLDCARREMREEFGLDLDLKRCTLIFVYDHDDTVADHVFACHVDETAGLELHEGAAVRWHTLNEIKQRPLGFFQERIVPYIEDHLRQSARNR